MTIYSRHSSNPFRVPTSQRGGHVLSSNDPLYGFSEDEDRSPKRRTQRVQCKLEVYDEGVDELDLFGGMAQDFRVEGDANAVNLNEDINGYGHNEDEEIGEGREFDEDEDEDDNDDNDMADHVVEDSDSEEDTLAQKSFDEQEQIEAEIEQLIDDVPGIDDDYRIVDRLGTGTFSSVYKAVDLHYHSMDNTPWRGHHPSNSSAAYQSRIPQPGSKVYVAIKRIYATSSPQRIENEIDILETLRGCRHISQIITAFRHRDQVVVVMPYHRNADFRDFYHDLSWEKMQSYFRCLFRALRDVHARGIIHRDVKPANFLFDPEAGVGVLCDFGLAQRLEESDPESHYCHHSSSTASHPHGKITPAAELPPSIRRQVGEAKFEAKRKSTWPSDRIGYLDNDTRPQVKVNRAGTRGFRPPEVLFKCSQQTGAIDTWAAGIILLFFLCGKFPLFRSNDDLEALMELATIFGRKVMERTATLHMRTFLTNVPSVPQDRKSWWDFCTELNPSLLTVGPPAKELVSNDSSSSLEIDSSEDRRIQVQQAIDLADHLLTADCTERYTPKQALDHPWLKEKEDDDEFVPHLPPGSMRRFARDR